VTVADAFGAPSASEPLVPLRIERRELGPGDVLIDIKFCGICHSDIHYCQGDWGTVPYPAIPGHEIAGIVAAVGASVTKHRLGDRVGVGCMVNSCRDCENCRRGEEQYCSAGNTQTYGSIDRDGTVTHGGYATRIVVDEDFVLRIPDAIDLDAAGPLMCAGITTYSPMRYWGVGPGKAVAVVGLGGLGHMAVKLAAAFGAEVTVLSQSLRKRDDGLRLGAARYHATSDPSTFDELAGSFDLIINTVSAELDINRFLLLLRTDGVLVNVGAPPVSMPVAVIPLMQQRRSFAGSAIGGIRETHEMLEFCAEHGIGPEIETIPAARINEAWDRVLASDVRYRFVIDTSTLGG
jgi:uncharacterized zinc-type alcohol dehydrogenase-like protein